MARRRGFLSGMQQLARTSGRLQRQAAVAQRRQLQAQVRQQQRSAAQLKQLGKDQQQEYLLHRQREVENATEELQENAITKGPQDCFGRAIRLRLSSQKKNNRMLRRHRPIHSHAHPQYLNNLIPSHLIPLYVPLALPPPPRRATVRLVTNQ